VWHFQEVRHLFSIDTLGEGLGILAKLDRKNAGQFLWKHVSRGLGASDQNSNRYSERSPIAENARDHQLIRAVIAE